MKRLQEQQQSMKSRSGKTIGPINSGDDLSFPRDFLELLAFNFDEARIWLGDRRMMMIDVSLFGELRRSLIEAVGVDQANKTLARIGFEAGRRDARLLAERYPAARTSPDKFAEMSPHRFQGITKLEIVSTSLDEQGRLRSGEWRWLHSVEADAHVRAFGRADAPTCWMELGYGTGYGYTLRGALIFFREIGCRAMGNDVCTIIGRSAELYEDVDEYLEYLDFLKPFVKIANLRKRPKGAKRQHASTQPLPAPELTPDMIVGDSPALTSAKDLLESVAGTNATVLISGESGVGKELFTRNLHRMSRRADKPFVPVNCAAIPDTLIEAELFGVERGAFTGATESRPGRFERASGGTLFLDEIGSLNHAAQVKLLRAIQEREIERVGGTAPIKVDVRIVAACNTPLRDLVADGEFRRDLFYRLNVFPIHVPPLRERRADIPALMQHYLHWYNRVHGKEVQRFTFEATKALLNYRYPGNIRELQNLIERAVILARGDTIGISQLFAYGESLDSKLWGLDHDGRLSAHGDAAEPQEALDELSNELMRLAADNRDVSWPHVEEQLFASLAGKALEAADGNVSAAARQLGMKRHQLEYRLKQLEMSAATKARD